MKSDAEAMRQRLIEDGVCTGNARLTALTGGVSSEIYRVDDIEQRFVVKRALEKLRVDSPWYADPRRNRAERSFLAYVANFQPESVPRLYPPDDAEGYFCMEYLGELRPWKQDLLRGRFDHRLAHLAGLALGRLHLTTWLDTTVRKKFDNTQNFVQLRIAPYLQATASNHPGLVNAIHAEAEAVLSRRLCLIHGDYSPKNLLVGEGRLVMVDCEVAWFGDPAFDLAFYLNHLFLKALYHADHPESVLALALDTLESYRGVLKDKADSVSVQAARLLPILMLARIDGTSPVEYFGATQQEQVRRFAIARIACDRVAPIKRLAELWLQAIKESR